MKKVFTLLLLIAVLFVSCDGSTNDNLFLSRCTHELYEVQDNGAWKCRECGTVLKGTDDDYILVLNSSGQPDKVYPLENNGELGFTVSGNIYNLVTESEKIFYIKTTDGTLLVNAGNSDIHRYGTIGDVALFAVKGSSYHEFGVAKDISVLKGHVELASTAEVKDLSVAKGAEDVSITVEEDSSVDVIAVYAEQASSVLINNTTVTDLGDNAAENAIASSGILTMTSDTVARVGNKVFTSLEAALNAGTQTDETIRLVSDISSSSEIAIRENQTLKISIGASLTNENGASVSNEGTLINYGSIINTSGSNIVVTGSSSSVVNFKTIDNQNGASMTISEGNSFVNSEIAVFENKGSVENNGTVEGNGTITGNKIEGTGTIQKTELVRIGDKKFISIEKAMEYVSDTDLKTFEIVFLKNDMVSFNVKTLINVEKDMDVTIDLSGFTIKAVSELNDTSAFVWNEGKLTVQDSTANATTGIGNGKIKMCATNPDLQSIPGYASNIITNRGTLVFNSGVLELDDVVNGQACYAIDANASIQNTETTVNGGYISRSLLTSQPAVRVYACSTTYNNKFTMNGGIIEGTAGVWVQLAGKGDAGKVELTVNGGQLIGHNATALNVAIANGDTSPRNTTQMKIRINGGRLTCEGAGGYCAIFHYNTSYPNAEYLKVSGGTFDYGLGFGICGGAVTASTLPENYPYPWIAEGYQAQWDTVNGIMTVVKAN